MLLPAFLTTSIAPSCQFNLPMDTMKTTTEETHKAPAVPFERTAEIPGQTAEPAERTPQEPAGEQKQTTPTYPNWVGMGSCGKVTLSPCKTRIIKTALPGSCEYAHRQNLRALVRECEVYQQLRPHKRFLAFYGFTATPDSASITLEYMPKGSLKTYLQEHPETSLLQRLKWCAEATEALYYLHTQKIVHSDVRPDNMLVGDDLSLKMMDFGGSAIGESPSLVGEATRYFLPREGDWVTTPNSDRFALGSSFYCIMTGKDPYHDLDSDGVADRYAKKEYPDVSSVLVGDVILKCWNCEYEKCTDVYTDLLTYYDKAK